DSTAVRLQELRGELADESESDDDDRLAQRRLRESHALKRNRAERRESAALKINAVGQHRAKVFRHGQQFGVRSIARARARHSVARAKLLHALADLDDYACGAVAERVRLVQLLAHGPERPRQSLAPDLLEDLPDKIGPLLRLADQTLATEFDEGALRARADERRRRAHYHATALSDGRRHVRHHALARLQILKKLLHLLHFRF